MEKIGGDFKCATEDRRASEEQEEGCTEGKNESALCCLCGEGVGAKDVRSLPGSG